MDIKNRIFRYIIRFSHAQNHFKEKINEIKPNLDDAKNYKGLLLQIVDVIIHKLFINTNPVDYYRYEFYQGTKTWREKTYYIGKSGSLYFPYEKNQIKYIPILDNKFLFKTMIHAFNLPQPRLLSTIGETYEIDTAEKFYSFLSSIDFDILIKPMEGSHGEGITVLNYKDGAFYSENRLFSPKKIWEHLKMEKLDYVVEQRVVQNEFLSSIHPSSLNTFRVITIKTNDGNWYAIRSYLRFGAGGGMVDNLGAGGILVGIDENGRSISAFAFDPKQKKKITHHPDTGKSLIGIRIDGHNKVIDLALNASEKFRFLGAIGWDIGLSLKGPVIIEANPFFDCSETQRENGPLLSEKIVNSLKKHYIWTRWDKTRIYPKLRNPKLRYRYFK